MDEITIFATRQDAIDHVIVPALDDPADYDMDAIFDACFTYLRTGNLARDGFVLTADEQQFAAAEASALRTHRLVWDAVEQVMVDGDWTNMTDSATLRLEQRTDDGDWEVVDTDGLQGDDVAWDEAGPYDVVEKRLAAAHGLDAASLQIVTPW